MCFKKVQNPELQENHNRGIPSLLGRILINEGHPSTSRAIAFPTGFSFQVSERTTNSMRWLLSRCHSCPPTGGRSFPSSPNSASLHSTIVWTFMCRTQAGIGGPSRHPKLVDPPDIFSCPPLFIPSSSTGHSVDIYVTLPMAFYCERVSGSRGWTEGTLLEVRARLLLNPGVLWWGWRACRASQIQQQDCGVKLKLTVTPVSVWVPYASYSIVVQWYVIFLFFGISPFTECVSERWYK